MSNLQPTNKQLEELRRKFITDDRIVALNQAITHVHEVATVRTIAYDQNGKQTIIYDEESEKLIKQFYSMIDDIFEKEYKIS